MSKACISGIEPVLTAARTISSLTGTERYFAKRKRTASNWQFFMAVVSTSWMVSCDGGCSVVERRVLIWLASPVEAKVIS